MRFTFFFLEFVDRGSSVGIATRYGLKGPGIESQWERGVPHPSRPALGPTQPPIQRPGRGVDHPPPYSVGIKEGVELYLYSPLGLHGLFEGELYPLPIFLSFTSVILGVCEWPICRFKENCLHVSY
jgi:hypothetical protein